VLFHSAAEVMTYLRRNNSSSWSPPEEEAAAKATSPPMLISQPAAATRWADIKMKQFRKVVPKRKRLVTSQVMVTPRVRQLMAQAAEDFDTGVELSVAAAAEFFRREPTVLVPRLAGMLRHVGGDVGALLRQAGGHHGAESTNNDGGGGDEAAAATASSPRRGVVVSIPINCVHSEEGRPNNTADLLAELRARQLDYDSKVCEENDLEETTTKVSSSSHNNNSSGGKEVEIEVGPATERAQQQLPPTPDRGQRSLRCRRLRQNYEETTVDDEEVFITYVKTSGRAQLPPPSRVLPPTAPPVVPNKGVECGEDASDGEEDEEDEDAGSNPKGRMRLGEAEVRALERHFERNPYPKRRERRAISQQLGLPAKKVRIWFQNKRNKTEDGRMRCFLVRHNILADGSVAAATTADGGGAKELQEDDAEDEEENSQFCRSCCKQFSTRWNYKVHRRKFHADGGRMAAVGIRCKECGRGFDTKWNLKTHQIELHSKPSGQYRGTGIPFQDGDLTYYRNFVCHTIQVMIFLKIENGLK
jgi:hypothetical protein